MPKRWCLTCNTLFDADLTGTQRCPVHEDGGRARRARATVGRPGTSARGYGSVYRRRARAVVAEAKREQLPCGICGEPCLPEQAIVAHHPDSDGASGDPALVRLVGAHEWCNNGFRPGRVR